MSEPADENAARDAFLAVMGDEPEMVGRADQGFKWFVAALHAYERIKGERDEALREAADARREAEEARASQHDHVCRGPALVPLNQWRALVRSEYKRRKEAKERGFTREKFATELGISDSTLFRILRNRKPGEAAKREGEGGGGE